MVSTHLHTVYTFKAGEKHSTVYGKCIRCRVLVALRTGQRITIGRFIPVTKERFDPATGGYRKRRFWVAKTRSGLGCIDCSMKMVYLPGPPQPPYGRNDKIFLED